METESHPDAPCLKTTPVTVPDSGKLTPDWLSDPTAEEDPWRVATNNPQGEVAREVILGNGRIGIAVGAEGSGGYSHNLAPCRIAGLWSADRLVLPPDFSVFRYHDGQSVFSRQNGRFETYFQELNLRTGKVTTSAIWQSAERRRSRIQISACLLRHDPRVLFQEMCIIPMFDGLVYIEDAVDGRGCEAVDSWMNRRMGAEEGGHRDGDAARDHHRGGGGDTGQSGDLLAFGCPLGSNRTPVWMISRILPESGAPERIDWHSLPAAFFRKLTFRAQKDRPIRIRRMVMIVEEVSGKEAVQTACRQLSELGWDEELTAHQTAMETLWAPVPKLGQPRLQCLLNVAYHHLFCAMREDSCTGLAPLGLVGKRWRGSTFWDADAWIHPALLDTHPELAATIPLFRRNTLPAAMQLAEQEGYEGAAYPWMADVNGNEVCHLETFRKERHVSNAVVLAAMRQWELNRDPAWLKEVLWPIASAVAAYWVSRAEPIGDSYHLSGLCGPDEAAGCVDDNAYTMATTACVIRFAIQLAGLLGESIPTGWESVAEGLHVPWDEKQDIPREHAAYNGETIKQADTTLLVYPWNLYEDPGLALRISRFYRDRYPESPIMMTHPVDGLIELQHGNRAGGKEALNAMLPALHGPFLTLAESATPMLTPFLTGYGGLIQLIKSLYSESFPIKSAKTGRQDPSVQ